MTFWTYLYRELRRRHRQAILTALGLALGICLVIAVSASASGVRNAQAQVLHSLYGVGTDITVTQTATAGSASGFHMDIGPQSESQQGKKFSRDRLMSTPGLALIADTKVSRVAGLSGVQGATGALTLTATHVSGTFFHFGQGQSSSSSGFGGGGTQPSTSTPTVPPITFSSFSITGVDVAEPVDQTIGPLSSTSLKTGRAFTTRDAKAKVALVDSGYAEQKSLTVGDTLTIKGTKFTVVGITTSASATSNVYIPLWWAQKLSDAAGKVNQLYVKATSATQIATVAKEIEATMKGATVTTAQDLANEASGSLSNAAKLAWQLGTWLAAAALIAAVAIASLLTLSTVSRRVREFGTLKALGWRSRRIVGQVLGESLVVGIVGGAVGVGLGYGATLLINSFAPKLQAVVSQGAAASPTGFRSESPTVSGTGGPVGGIFHSFTHTVTVTLHAPLSLNLLLAALALAIAGGLVAGGFGGWRAARLSPADALRRVD